MRPGKFHVDYDLTEDGCFQVKSGSQVTCLEIADVEVYFEPGFGFYSLVLRECVDKKYERIGVARWDEDTRLVTNTAEVADFFVI